MQFKDYPYERIDLEAVKKAYEKALSKLESAKDLQSFDQAMGEFYAVRNQVDTANTIASVRFSINMNDPFYDEENTFYDEIGPVLEGYVNRFYKILVTSPMKEGLIQRYGIHLFNLADLAMTTYSDMVVDDLKEENRLVTSYSRLVGNAKIVVDGKTYNLSTITPLLQDKDRAVRLKGQRAMTQFFEDNEVELDRIYDELVRVRHQIALKLGFENFVELGYARLNRTDYGPKEVAAFRKQVKEFVVPVRESLRGRQAKRLGLTSLTYVDTPLYFNSGNPKPAGDEAYLVSKAEAMYEALSPETHEFFKFMTEGGLLDLSSREGKRPGGYCTYIANHHAPFIFANFNGTDHDVTVLTHEAGHAFQVFESRSYEITEYQWPTLEACEIHSMSMEYLTYPWMGEFFGQDLNKFKFLHSGEPAIFLPYGVTVDAFQHYVYENPSATPKMRKDMWSKLESEYMPDIDYEDNDFLKRGGFWYRQGHIFRSPFYYIDYTLALTCAAQFYVKSVHDPKKAWDDYLRLCQSGGSKPFTDLLKVADLKSPFEEGTLALIMDEVERTLAGIDDASF